MEALIDGKHELGLPNRKWFVWGQRIKVIGVGTDRRKFERASIDRESVEGLIYHVKGCD